MAVGRRIAAGDVVAGYEIGALAGRGGMGEVFRARDVRLERPVALKLLAERLSDDDGFRERMLRESRLAASLDHPNVVPIYEAGDAEGRLFIAMRFVDGVDLRALLRREGPLEPARAIAIATQVADALDAAHAKGLVHRDVKPSNVLLDQQAGREHVYLADFGLTQSVSDTGPADGQLMGTVDYVAPEQIRGDRVDGRADVYALGCLLFEALTGSLPFSGASDVAVVYAHLSEEPPRASERRPGLRSEVDAVLAGAMAKDPEDRPDTCRALVEATREALGLGASGRGARALVAVALGALALAIATVAAGVLLVGSEAAEAEPGGAILEVDPRSGEAVGSVPTVAAPTHIAATSGQVWFATTDTVWRLDPTVGRPVKVEAVGYVHDLAGVDRTMYVARDGEKLLEGIVVPYGAVDGARSDGVSLLACALSASPSLGLWAAGCPNVQHVRVEPNRISVDRTVRIPFQQPTTAGTVRNCLCSMTVGAGSLWVAGDAADPRVFRVTPAGKLSAAIRLPHAPRAIAFAAGAIWVSGPLDDVVMRIDPETNRVVARVPVAGGPAGMVAYRGQLWVALHVGGKLARIDTARSRVATEVDVAGHPFELAVARDRLWVTSDAG